MNRHQTEDTVTQSVGTELLHCMCLARSSNQGLGRFQLRSLMEIHLLIYSRLASGPRPDLLHLFLDKSEIVPGNTLNAIFHKRSFKKKATLIIFPGQQKIMPSKAHIKEKGLHLKNTVS